MAPQKMTKTVFSRILEELKALLNFHDGFLNVLACGVDLMFEAVPYSSRSMLMASLICFPGGT